MNSTTGNQDAEREMSSFIADKPGGIVVAFSGGSDSLGMLCLLKKLYHDRLLAVYVNHNLRSAEELEAEAHLNAENCRRIDVPFVTVPLAIGEVQALADKRGCGTEEAARILRYKALEAQRIHGGLDWIATAHTSDDQMETVLMRFLSGKALCSLSGIKKQQGRILRPVLGFRREELEKQCTEMGLRWSDDSTNNQMLYLRNRIRHHIIPAIKDVFPSFSKAILRFAHHMEAMEAPDGMFDQIEKGLPLSVFEGLDDMRIMGIVYGCWDAALGSDFVSLSHPMADRILKAIKSGRSVSMESSGVCVSIIRGRLFIMRIREVPFWDFKLDLSKPGEAVELPGGHVLRRGCFEQAEADSGRCPCGGVSDGGENPISGTEKKACREPADAGRQRSKRKSLSDGPDVYLFPQFLRGEVHVRQVMEGDVITLANGKKRVSSLMREMGIPRALRGLVPVISDRDGVVAVMGSAFGGRDRICRKCKCRLAPDALYLYILE